LIVICAGTLLACLPQRVGRTAPFRLRIVDQDSRFGLPELRVTTETGVAGKTEFDGSVLFWLDTALMDRYVRFDIEHHGTVTQVSVPVTGGGLVAIAVPDSAVATR
jgi:hypothetical protein